MSASSRLSKTARNGATLYSGVVNYVAAQIARGELAPGARLPTISALGAQFGVSHITIRTALRELAAMGLVEARRGSGVYVRGPIQIAPEVERTVAFVVPAWPNDFMGDVLWGVEAACREAGRRLIIVNSGNQAGEEAARLRELIGKVEGIIVTPAFARDDAGVYAELLERGVPFVFADRYVAGIAAPRAQSDHARGAYRVTQHLIQSGRRRIAAIGEFAGRGHTSIAERVRGYKRALRDAGIALDPRLVRLDPDCAERAGYAQTRALLADLADAEKAEPWAIFALNERIARGCYRALREADLQIPGDVAVAGFDDTLAVLLDPPLTTVRQDLHGIGRAAVELLLELAAKPGGGARRARVARVESQLIVRNSTDGALASSLPLFHSHFHSDRASGDFAVAPFSNRD